MADAQGSFHLSLQRQLNNLSRVTLFNPQDNYRSAFRDHNAAGMVHLQVIHCCLLMSQPSNTYTPVHSLPCLTLPEMGSH